MMNIETGGGARRMIHEGFSNSKSNSKSNNDPDDEESGDGASSASSTYLENSTRNLKDRAAKEKLQKSLARNETRAGTLRHA